MYLAVIMRAVPNHFAFGKCQPTSLQTFYMKYPPISVVVRILQGLGWQSSMTILESQQVEKIPSLPFHILHTGNSNACVRWDIEYVYGGLGKEKVNRICWV